MLLKILYNRVLWYEMNASFYYFSPIMQYMFQLTTPPPPNTTRNIIVCIIPCRPQHAGSFWLLLNICSLQVFRHASVNFHILSSLIDKSWNVPQLNNLKLLEICSICDISLLFILILVTSNH